MARTAGSHSDITGPRVRAAAIKLFAQNGYAAVSMRAIAAEVGVQVGALYNYTPDKQTLLFQVMHDHMTEVLAAAIEAATETKSTTATQRLHQFVQFHIRFHAGRPDEIFIAYMELRNLSPENFAQIEELRRAYEDQLEKILQAGIASQEFQIADTKISTLALIAMLTGVNTWYRSGGRLSLDEVAAQYSNMALNAVGVKPTV